MKENSVNKAVEAEGHAVLAAIRESIDQKKLEFLNSPVANHGDSCEENVSDYNRALPATRRFIVAALNATPSMR